MDAVLVFSVATAPVGAGVFLATHLYVPLFALVASRITNSGDAPKNRLPTKKKSYKFIFYIGHKLRHE